MATASLFQQLQPPSVPASAAAEPASRSAQLQEASQLRLPLRDEDMPV